jgi:hypothetical protein
MVCHSAPERGQRLPDSTHSICQCPLAARGIVFVYRSALQSSVPALVHWLHAAHPVRKRTCSGVSTKHAHIPSAGSQVPLPEEQRDADAHDGSTHRPSASLLLFAPVQRS